MPLCATCGGRSFVTPQALRRHLTQSSTPHPFCNICDRQFVHQQAYEQHTAALHHFECPICDQVFKSKGALKQHHRDSPGHPRCKKCDRNFVSPRALQAHRLDSRAHHVYDSGYTTSSIGTNSPYATPVRVESTATVVDGEVPDSQVASVFPERIPLPESPVQEESNFDTDSDHGTVPLFDSLPGLLSQVMFMTDEVKSNFEPGLQTANLKIADGPPLASQEPGGQLETKVSTTTHIIVTAGELGPDSSTEFHTKKLWQGKIP